MYGLDIVLVLDGTSEHVAYGCTETDNRQQTSNFEKKSPVYLYRRTTCSELQYNVKREVLNYLSFHI